MAPSTSTSTRRDAANLNNAQASTGPRTAAGKARSSRNALTHGLTAQTPVLPSEDLTAYQFHCRQFDQEYQPQTPTEKQLVQELADTSWRLNRIPRLEADLLNRAAANRDSPEDRPLFDVVDAYRAVASLGMHGQRLSRQFQNTLNRLRELQAERLRDQRRDLQRAAALLHLHKNKGIPYDPTQDGFVFSIPQIEEFAEREARRNRALHVHVALLHRPLAASAGVI